jgi:uncharacterized protein YbgA (DUF1722 family)
MMLNIANRLGYISYCHISEWINMGPGLVSTFAEHLQDNTTNKYNIIVISTLKSSLERSLVFSVLLHVSW